MTAVAQEPTEDEALVARAQRGDYAAFDELVTRHEDRLYALALSITRRPADAEDAVQNAFVAVLEHLNEFRGDAPFAAWLRRIAVNAALKTLRRRRTEAAVPLEGDDEAPIQRPELTAPWRGEPAALVEAGELRRILAEAVERLPEGQRLVFVLRDQEGLSVAETAQALALSEANVKVRLLRARLALREELTRRFMA